ncbi:NAD(P)H-dependent glycerol-3-phosphate dehydrogenase [Saprospira sp. CCB-QB6]|uniref:NAD(P)H-dependent glycerol-3-phosphate dehydrogenase n=1 Tax=Saprospira sp. CCB-QB6 TaxID=3023936 RepID=UPI00234B36C9|nr:NAD(P)H-dependent glycerol-3-phosphate dehydrogenase [Saprospira sp. CCB-QB6]WCL80976.1 NAD(P)H-dependent glycerol-3-phosphate dehydrogenase [Saprospira sp. CCB-QB6]
MSKYQKIKIEQAVGVIGAGSFGLTIAGLLAENVEDILIYTRREENKAKMQAREGEYAQLSPKIRVTTSLEEVAKDCQLIFPVVPSKGFRSMMQQLGPLLNPQHFLIHATKGLDRSLAPKEGKIKPEHIKTMSQLIELESLACRVGCLSGPNLASEIQEHQPAATLIASRYTEVIKMGQAALRSSRFQVYGTHDILGAELAGALKNVVALAAGLLGGRGLGMNIWALLVTRGLSEMVHIGKAMGADVKAFLGVAGIGDLIATASSTKSRNYKAGVALAQGTPMQEIVGEDGDMVEGFRTLEIINQLCQALEINSPIFEIVYRVVFKGMELERAIHFLMTYPYAVDVDFL